MRKGQSAQPVATHLRTSASLPPEQSRHFARIALIGLSGCTSPRRSCSGLQPGNLPTWAPPSAKIGDGSRQGCSVAVEDFGSSIADVFVGGVLCTRSAWVIWVRSPLWLGLEPGRKRELPLGLLLWYYTL